MQSLSSCRTNKGEKSDSSNYSEIILLSVADNILACVFLNRFIPSIVEENAPESQCGFRINGEIQRAKYKFVCGSHRSHKGIRPAPSAVLVSERSCPV